MSKSQRSSSVTRWGLTTLRGRTVRPPVRAADTVPNSPTWLICGHFWRNRIKQFAVVQAMPRSWRDGSHAPCLRACFRTLTTTTSPNLGTKANNGELYGSSTTNLWSYSDREHKDELDGGKRQWRPPVFAPSCRLGSSATGVSFDVCQHQVAAASSLFIFTVSWRLSWALRWTCRPGPRIGCRSRWVGSWLYGSRCACEWFGARDWLFETSSHVSAGTGDRVWDVLHPVPRVRALPLPVRRSDDCDEPPRAAPLAASSFNCALDILYS